MIKNYVNDLPKLAQKYIYRLIDLNKSPETIRTYSHSLKLFFEWYQNEVGTEMTDDIINKIKYEDLSNYQSYLTSKNYKSGTKYKRLIVLRTFWNWLNEEFDYKNIAKKLKLPTIEDELPKYLKDKEVIRFLNVIDEYNSKFKKRDKAMFVILLNCAIRKSELLNINMEDIIERKNRMFLKINRKGRKQQMIALNEPTKFILEKYIKTRKSNHPALFLSKYNQRISNSNFQVLFNKYSKLAKLKGYSIHKLRHTAATKMYEKTKDIKTLQEILGHKSIKSTQIYTHVGEEQKNNMIDSISYE